MIVCKYPIWKEKFFITHFSSDDEPYNRFDLTYYFFPYFMVWDGYCSSITSSLFDLFCDVDSQINEIVVTYVVLRQHWIDDRRLERLSFLFI